METTKEKVSSKMSNFRDQAPTEGELTKNVEQFTAQIPSLGWMGIAMASLALSVGVATFSEKKWFANFVGHWVPTFLMIGLYNKMVKQSGSDRETLH